MDFSIDKTKSKGEINLLHYLPEMGIVNVKEEIIKYFFRQEQSIQLS